MPAETIQPASRAGAAEEPGRGFEQTRLPIRRPAPQRAIDEKIGGPHEDALAAAGNER